MQLFSFYKNKQKTSAGTANLILNSRVGITGYLGSRPTKPRNA